MRILSREKPPRSWAIGWPVDLAEQVPERDVERRIAAHLGAGRAEAEIADESLAMRSICERIPAEHLRRQRLVDIGLDRLGAEEGLAEAGEPFVGMNPQPQQIGELRERGSFRGR